MSRGRQQKWICKDCKAEFSVQGNAPKFCCSCSSVNILHAPSYELALTFEEKRKELEKVCAELNPIYAKYSRLKAKYTSIMAYWKQQKRRGYITADEYTDMASMFQGCKPGEDNKR